MNYTSSKQKGAAFANKITPVKTVKKISNYALSGVGFVVGFAAGLVGCGLLNKGRMTTNLNALSELEVPEVEEAKSTASKTTITLVLPGLTVTA